MTLQEHGQTADTSSEHRRGPLITAMLAVVLLVVTGGWLIVDSQQEGAQPAEVAGAPAEAQDDPDPTDGLVFWTGERVEVSGEGSCTITDGVNFTCNYAMTDSRLSGTETFTATPGNWGTQFPFEAPQDFRFQTKEGSWVGVLGRDTETILYWCRACDGLHGWWDVEYTGTGAYEGLVYHQFFNHGDPDGVVRVSGWIEPASGN